MAKHLDPIAEAQRALIEENATLTADVAALTEMLKRHQATIDGLRGDLRRAQQHALIEENAKLRAERAAIVAALQPPDDWPLVAAAEACARAAQMANELADERAKLREENFALAAWQCIFHDGRTGIVCDEHGNQFCAKDREAAKLREVNAAQAAENDRLREQLRQAQQHALTVRDRALEEAASHLERYGTEGNRSGRLIEAVVAVIRSLKTTTQERKGVWVEDQSSALGMTFYTGKRTARSGE